MPNQGLPLFEQLQLKIPPQSSDIEVTLFGKGVGESIVIHFGDGRYAVIDSFFASHNKILLKIDKDKISHNSDVLFCALSPQDIELGNYLVGLNIPKEKTISYSFPDDNDISVVVWLDIGGSIVLFGGDLEEKPVDNSGWKAVIKEHTFTGFTGKADLFKVPHHGSNNSHNADIWDSLLRNKPISILSVFNRSDLPQKSDKDRIKALSAQTFIAGAVSRKTKDLNKLLKDFNITIKALPSTIGVIRARKEVGIENAVWDIECFGDVEKLNK